jgi:hypothetical protein
MWRGRMWRGMARRDVGRSEARVTDEAVVSGDKQRPSGGSGSETSDEEGATADEFSVKKSILWRSAGEEGGIIQGWPSQALMTTCHDTREWSSLGSRQLLLRVPCAQLRFAQRHSLALMEYHALHTSRYGWKKDDGSNGGRREVFFEECRRPAPAGPT